HPADGEAAERGRRARAEHPARALAAADLPGDVVYQIATSVRSDRSVGSVRSRAAAERLPPVFYVAYLLRHFTTSHFIGFSDVFLIPCSTPGALYRMSPACAGIVLSPSVHVPSPSIRYRNSSSACLCGA